MIAAKKLNYLLIAALAGVILAWIFWPSKQVVMPQPGHIDTVQVQRRIYITHIDTLKQVLPQKVFIYLPDTVTRQKIEKEDIITRVTVGNGLLAIEKLTPRGVGIRVEHQLPVLAAFEIDGQGRVAIVNDKKERRKAWFRKLGNRALIIGGFVGGVFIGSKL